MRGRSQVARHAPLFFLWLFATACVAVSGRQVSSPDHAALAGNDRRVDSPEVVWQVMHRSARLRDERLSPSAASRALDTAIGLWADTEYPLDALAELVPEGGRLLVVETPDVGPLATALAERLRLVSSAVTRLPLAAAVPESAVPGDVESVIVVWRPGWGKQGIVEPLEEAEAWLSAAGLPAARLVAADLFEPSIDGRPWPADTVLLGSPSAVAVAARFMLEARFAGQVPDANRIAESRGLALDRMTWHRRAIFDRVVSRPRRD